MRAALHIRPATAPASRFSYRSSGPASVTLYPELVRKYRIMIYNGDADSCVPYVGNEEWTTDLANTGALSETKAWHPWYVSGGGVPAGYATEYSVKGAAHGFSFVTIRLAGHMVPTFQPSAALTMFANYIADRPF